MVNHREQAIEKIARAAIVPTDEDAVRLADEADEHLDQMILDYVKATVRKLRPVSASMRADLWWDGYDEALTDLVDTLTAQLKEETHDGDLQKRN